MKEEYKFLIENLETEKVIELMKKLGADNYIEKEDCVIFPTICHNVSSEQASMKLYYYKDNKFFYCFTEDGGMSIFNFLKTYYETRQYEFNWYEDIFRVVESCTKGKLLDNFEFNKPYTIRNNYIKKERKVELPIYPSGILDVFIKQYPYEWLSDGISKEAMDKYNILYSISQNKIIIPHYDIKNNLIGIRGRALDPWEIENVGKYTPVKIEKRLYNHRLSLNLYGLNFNLENIKKEGVVYLFESEKAVLQFESFKRKNCAVAVCGSNFNKFQLNLLLKYCYPKEIVVCFDKEELPGQDKYFNKLWSICNKYNQYCDFSFLYDRENLLNLKDSPSDKGEAIFEVLLNKRVKVRSNK